MKRVLWVTLGSALVAGLSVGLLFLLLGENLLGIYNSDPEVIYWGMVRMTMILPTYFLCGLMDVAGSQMRGMGFSILPMIVSLSGACAFRLIWIFTVYAAHPTMQILYLSYPISWALTFFAHIACYMIWGRKKLHQMEETLSA